MLDFVSLSLWPVYVAVGFGVVALVAALGAWR